MADWLYIFVLSINIISMGVLMQPTVIERSTCDDENGNNSLKARPSYKEYLSNRENLIANELNLGFEHDVLLTERETLANEIIMKLKRKELSDALINPLGFKASRHIFEVLDEIQKSKLFKIIRRMPKGAILHAHDTALCSADYLVSLTYRDHLWQCSINDRHTEFKFSRNKPEPLRDVSCQWVLVRNARNRVGAQYYDANIRSKFTLFDKNINPRIQFKDINDVWSRFMLLFQNVAGIVTYAPVWKDYYKRALEEMRLDGVDYLEFRGILPELYDLDGKSYNEEQVMQLYVDGLDEYKADNPDFIGSKFIYAPLKAAPNSTVQTYFEIVQRLHEKFPDFLAGFDLVGQEDSAPSIIDFAENLLKLPEDIKFFLHAGETNWYGSVDENLVDAILLGSKRIGHGYALDKHPSLLEIVKQKDIAVEVNPVSNQVLKLIDDYRNHPASVFFANNVPIVISSDDPSFWEVTPLSHDFYMAFMGISSKHHDLRTLKKLAKNSIKYSSLSGAEKQLGYNVWQTKWDKFIESVINENGSRTNSA